MKNSYFLELQFFLILRVENSLLSWFFFLDLNKLWLEFALNYYFLWNYLDKFFLALLVHWLWHLPGFSLLNCWLNGRLFWTFEWKLSFSACELLKLIFIISGAIFDCETLALSLSLNYNIFLLSSIDFTEYAESKLNY